jgi:TraL protein
MSFDAQSHVVPHGLEGSIPILFWSPTEFTLAISLMGFGLIMDLWMFGMAGGAAVLIGSRYLGRGAKKGAVQHMLWAFGLQLDAPISAQFQPAWKNDFIP